MRILRRKAAKQTFRSRTEAMQKYVEPVITIKFTG